MSKSVDLRLPAVLYRPDGHTYAETAKIFHVSVFAARTRVQKYQETGGLSDKPSRRGFKKIDPEKLRAYAKEHPDATQREIADEFHCSNQAAGKAPERPNITRKKKRAAARNGTKRNERPARKHRSLFPKKSALTRTNPALTPVTTGNTAALRAEKRFSGRFPA